MTLRSSTHSPVLAASWLILAVPLAFAGQADPSDSAVLKTIYPTLDPLNPRIMVDAGVVEEAQVLEVRDWKQSPNTEVAIVGWKAFRAPGFVDVALLRTAPKLELASAAIHLFDGIGLRAGLDDPDSAQFNDPPPASDERLWRRPD